MKTFIKVTEIWLPDKTRTYLQFGSGLYGDLIDFKTTSEKQCFAYDEGLPGKAWATGHPIILNQFESSYFKRTLSAHEVGLTCGIALPIFSGDFLLAVVVFLCGDDDEQAGAIELWSNLTEPHALHFVDGYYGNLDYFGNISKLAHMVKGDGLPGLSWHTKRPVLIEDLGTVSEFTRANDAQLSGITTALGIPFITQAGQVYVMTFLSAKATPIAKRIQIWIPDDKRLVCQHSHSKNTNNLAELFETLPVDKGIGALGRVWLSGLPAITHSQDHDNYNTALDMLNSMLAIPIINNGELKAIVTFLF